MLAPIIVAMVLIEAHFPPPGSRDVLFPMRWPVLLARKVFVPKQPKYG